MEQKIVQYLVTESDGTTHLPYTDQAGKADHRLMGAAWAALHEGYRGKKYEGPNKTEALRKLTDVYKREGIDTPGSKSMPGLLEFKSIKFEVKELSESGRFTGTASVYGNKDLGNDVMEKGAFAKTLSERSKVPLMDSHKSRVGVAEVKDSPNGLEAEGIINLDKQSGRDLYSDLKFYQANDMPMGLSIGYQTVKADPASSSADGARHLKEVRLWEVTVTEFPMNEMARVASVKSLFGSLIESKDDFTQELRELQLYSARWMMMQALGNSLCDIICEDDYTPEEKVSASSDTIDQFKAAYLEILPEYLSMTSGSEYMSMPAKERKAGRMFSGQNRTAIKKVIDDLQALLDSEAGTTTSADDAAAKSITEPGDHSAVESFISSVKSLLPAA